jgi:hypothetical protein
MPSDSFLLTVRAALVACDDVDRFIDQFHKRLPPTVAAISDTFTLIDIGARASFSAAAAAVCKQHQPWNKCFVPKSKSETEFGFYNEMQEYSEMTVSCSNFSAGAPNAPETVDAFVGIVMLLLLPFSDLTAKHADGTDEYYRRILDAAGNVASTAELGLTTSLAGNTLVFTEY